MSRRRRTQAEPPAAPPLPAPAAPPAGAAHHARPGTARVEPKNKRPYVAAALAVAIVALAWWGAGALTRRAQGARLPPLADLSGLPAPAREHVEEADAAARAHPREAGALGALGMAYHAALLPGPATDIYALAEQLDPAGWRWTYYRGLLLEERGRQPEALEAFTRVTSLDSAQGMAWFRIGEIAFKEGRLDDAERAYRLAAQAPAAAPFVATGVASRQVTALAAYASMGQARVAIDRGQRTEAIAELDSTIARYPAFGPARMMRVQLDADASSRDAEARAARAYTPPSDPLLDAVVAESRMRDLLLKHAALAQRGGDAAWREFLVRRALQFNPRDPNVLMEMAGMLQASGRFSEALDYLRQHQQVVPGDHHTLVEEGRVLSDLGQYTEAESVLRRATRVRDAAAEYNLGAVLDRMGRTDEARAHYQAALTIDPYHARAMNNLGVWLDRSGQSAAAIAMLERSIRAAPDNAEAYSNLGSALIGARRLPEAMRTLETAVALAPAAPDAHNNLGIALAQSGRFPEAEREFTTALRLNPKHQNARRNLEQIAGMRR
jgi:tetratricopeptide (TPR) repeat protein